MRPAMAAGGTSSEIKIIRAICPRPATSDPWSPPILRPTRDNEAACNLYTSRKVRLWPQSESVKIRCRATLAARSKISLFVCSLTRARRRRAEPAPP